MIRKAALLTDSGSHFSRFIEDCEVTCEQVTPQLLSAPFYRGHFSILIVPAGFANPKYTRLLPALHASSERIRRFIETGGKLLVFGPGIARKDAYDWLPFPLVYQHAPSPRGIQISSESRWGAIFSDYDMNCIECDGYFSSYEGDVVASAGSEVVAVAKEVKAGIVIATTIHEYPSRCFMAEFCSAASETLF